MTARIGHNQLTREQWAARIGEAWKGGADNMLSAIFGIATDLINARKRPPEGGLPHGEFETMIKTDLPFGPRTAQMFMKIGRDQRLTELYTNHGSLLVPASWRILYDLTRLDNETFYRLLQEGIINPEMERSDIAKELRLARVREDEARILTIVPIIGKFRTIVLDPAWEYDWLSLAGRAKPGYAMQSIEQLEALNVAAWADVQPEEGIGCHLYCWTTNNFMAEACRLVRHWGFQHRTLITWEKPPPFGLGSYFRNSTEHCLFATLGEDTTTRHAAASIATHFTAPRGEHSEKPECFYDIVRAASYPPYGEGNQREPRADFTNLFEEREHDTDEAAE
jgi:N6-adenosine-specific RNA methylase IME4